MLLALLLAAAPDTSAYDWAVRAKTAVEAWQNCTLVAAIEIAAQTKEPAGDVADAALGRCNSNRADVVTLMIERGTASDDAKTFMEGHTTNARRQLLDLVIQTRARQRQLGH